MTPEERGRRADRTSGSTRELELLAALQTGNAEVVQRARPRLGLVAEAAAERRNRLVLGLLLAVGLTLLREQTRPPPAGSQRTSQSSSTCPCSRSIPEERVRRATTSPPTARFRRLDTEAFRMLRTNLRYFNVDEELNSILVMSAEPEEGKTSIAWNLARAEARAGKRVLCIEADLRRPTLATRLDVAADGGLSLILAGVMDPGDASRP